MAYPLSPTKLLTYQRCPQAYYFKYQRKLPEPSFFGSTALGNALHDVLRDIYTDWTYREPIPPIDWFATCWSRHTDALSEAQVHQGWQALEQYYQTYIADAPTMRKPLGIEGKITGTLVTDNVEFLIRGRYDRLDYCDGGLALIDYKSSRTVKTPDALDLQLGLYSLMLEQTYHQALRRMSLIYLRAGQQVNYSVTPQHLEQVRSLIGDLALRLKADRQWQPVISDGCDRCSFQRYCAAKSPQPEPLPESAQQPQGVQLVLSL